MDPFADWREYDSDQEIAMFGSPISESLRILNITGGLPPDCRVSNQVKLTPLRASTI